MIYNLDKSECTNYCPLKSYKDTVYTQGWDLNSCVDCTIINCTDCLSSNVCNYCNHVAPLLSLDKSECLTACPDGQYDNLRKCHSCQAKHPNCKKCSFSKCLECDDSNPLIPYYMYPNLDRCETSCQYSYRVNGNGICEKCEVNNCKF